LKWTQWASHVQSAGACNVVLEGNHNSIDWSRASVPTGRPLLIATYDMVLRVSAGAEWLRARVLLTVLWRMRSPAPCQIDGVTV